MDKKTKRLFLSIFAGTVGFIILSYTVFGITLYKINAKTDDNYKEIQKVNNSLTSEIEDLEEDVSSIKSRFESLDFTEDNSEKVYITKTGKRYHYDENCVVYPIESTLNKAVAKGLTPCQKCSE